MCSIMRLQVYDHQYKAVVDGVETDSVMEIDPGRRIEIFRMGNGSNEVLEVHDFKNVSATPQAQLTLNHTLAADGAVVGEG